MAIPFPLQSIGCSNQRPPQTASADEWGQDANDGWGEDANDGWGENDGDEWEEDDSDEWEEDGDNKKKKSPKKGKKPKPTPTDPPQSGGLILSKSKPNFGTGKHSLKSLPVPSSTAQDPLQRMGQTNIPEGPTSGSTSIEKTGGTVANASRVVRSMRARFRGCYQTGLRSNPNIQGSITLTAKIGPNGNVKGIDEKGDGGLAPIIPCLKAVVSSGKFTPPQGGDSKVVIPIKFVR